MKIWARDPRKEDGGGKREFHPVLLFENCSIYIHGPDYLGAWNRIILTNPASSLEQDLNGTARLLVRLSYDLAFEQDLRDALAAEREKERELDVSGIPIPLWLPVDCAVKFPPISAKRKRVRMKTSIKKHVSKVMTSLLMPSLLISISRWHFSMQKFKYSGS